MWRIICHWRIAERFSLFVSFFVFLTIFSVLAFSSSRSDTFTKFMTIVRFGLSPLVYQNGFASSQWRWNERQKKERNTFYVALLRLPHKSQSLSVFTFTPMGFIGHRNLCMYNVGSFDRSTPRCAPARPSISFISSAQKLCSVCLSLGWFVSVGLSIPTDIYSFSRMRWNVHRHTPKKVHLAKLLLLSVDGLWLWWAKCSCSAHFSCWCITIKSIIRRSTPLLSPSSEI